MTFPGEQREEEMRGPKPYSERGSRVVMRYRASKSTGQHGSRPRGFWLTEVLASLWLIAFIGAGVIGLFTYLVRSSSIANERAAAELLADRLIERAVRIGPPNWGLEPGQVGQFLESSEGPQGTVLTYQLMPMKVGEHRLGTLFCLRVQIAWDEADAKRVERGRGELVRQRNVYIENLAASP